DTFTVLARTFIQPGARYLQIVASADTQATTTVNSWYEQHRLHDRSLAFRLYTYEQFFYFIPIRCQTLTGLVSIKGGHRGQACPGTRFHRRCSDDRSTERQPP